jgi:site-specific DNA-methyltransferase (adenine-specific)
VRPYYEQSGVTIYHGDCREVLGDLAHERLRVDAILTDPPYGVGKASWDAPEAVWPMLTDAAQACSLLLKPDGVCFWFCSQGQLPRAIEATSPLRYRWLFIWHVTNGMQGGALGFANYTPALVLGGGNIWRQMQDLRSIPLVPDAFLDAHPTGKPEALMIYLVARTTTAPGQLVLDPFMGGGTTVVAAKRLGHRAIGIEQDERYCELAARRLQQEALPLEVA